MDDGWDDDDDIDLDETLPENSPATEVQLEGPEETVVDGWDDFGDLGDDANEDIVQDDSDGLPAAAPVVVAAPVPIDKPQSFPSTEKDGWEEEEDVNLDFDDDGWGEDVAVIDDIVKNEEASPLHSKQSPFHVPPQRSNHLFQELDTYVRSLERMLSSINAVLEYEYNTPEKAQELVEYYASRPQLAEYTVTKELQRMNYQIVLPNGHVETDKQQIIDQNLLSKASLVARASNQSLLADLLHVITGPDLIVRPQYLAICVASWCQFNIHLGDGQDLVQCQAKLRLSLPTEHTGNRLDIAEVGVGVVFAPSQPMVEYKVHRIDILLQEPSQLEGSVQFLAAMEGHWDEMPEIAENERLQNAPADIFRDQFLVNSQRFLSQSTQGMKSALNQVDSVINVRGKLQTISNFIPATDIMLAAEQEAMELAEARRKEMERRQQDHHPSQHQITPSQHMFPRPQPPQTDPQGPVQRPKSILGSLFGAVAHTVALPDEDEEVIFGAAAPQPTPMQSPPHFYRKDDEEKDAPSSNAAFPKLYQRDEPPKEVSEGLPTLYRKEERPERFPGAQPPTLYRKEVETSQHSAPVNTMPTPASMDPGRYNDNRLRDPIEPIHEDHFPHDREEIVADGWDEEIAETFDDVVDDEEDVDRAKPTINTNNVENNQDTVEAGAPEDGWDDVDAEDVRAAYDDDIVPTRKRWLNPRPNRPYLYGLGY
jgi:hypothetical protein